MKSGQKITDKQKLWWEELSERRKAGYRAYIERKHKEMAEREEKRRQEKEERKLNKEKPKGKVGRPKKRGPKTKIRPYICRQKAQKCSTRKEFKEKYPKEYNAARKRGLLKEFTWFRNSISKEEAYTSKNYVIYVYEDKENNVAYVGLTCERQKRHTSHKREKSPVARYFKSINKEVPEPIYLKEGLDAESAQAYEGQYLDEYRKNGWLMLNKAKPGGLGSPGAIIWSKEACLNAALNCKTRTELKERFPQAYKTAREKKYLNSYTWFKLVHKYDDYKTCYEEASKYKTKSQFQLKSRQAYMTAKKMGWIKDYVWLSADKECTYRRLDYDTCFDIAKKYKTRQDFRIYERRPYDKARENNWLNDYTWFKELHCKPMGYWTYDKCYEEAKKYETVAEFNKQASGAYKASLRNGWMDNFTWFDKRVVKN